MCTKFLNMSWRPRSLNQSKPQRQVDLGIHILPLNCNSHARSKSLPHPEILVQHHPSSLFSSLLRPLSQRKQSMKKKVIGCLPMIPSQDRALKTLRAAGCTTTTSDPFSEPGDTKSLNELLQQENEAKASKKPPEFPSNASPFAPST